MYFDKMDVVIDTYRNKQKGWSFAYIFIKKENRHNNMTYSIINVKRTSAQYPGPRALPCA